MKVINMAKVEVSDEKYSLWIGIIKSIKNVLITVGIPAVLVLANNYVEWLPKSWYSIGVPLISLVSYLIKNKIQYNNK
ncbi:hypothetical protein LCGC14_0846680 [marine sediment metagenome]|uniref:Uncharacterized protein n=1 Tax=marine sediment metagenome TaxID=412755 RepID=A0A0F9PBI4_9ZZZZ